MEKIERFKKVKAIATDLSSITKLSILDFLQKKDASNQEIFEELKNKLKVKYRSSIYSALDSLNKNGIIKKYYNEQDKKIKYSLTCNRIEFDLINFKVIFNMDNVIDG